MKEVGGVEAGVVDCGGNVVAVVVKGLLLVLVTGLGANLIEFLLASNTPGAGHPPPNVDEGALCGGWVCGIVLAKVLFRNGFDDELPDDGWLGGLNGDAKGLRFEVPFVVAVPLRFWAKTLGFAVVAGMNSESSFPVFAVLELTSPLLFACCIVIP